MEQPSESNPEPNTNPGVPEPGGEPPRNQEKSNEAARPHFQKNRHRRHKQKGRPSFTPSEKPSTTTGDEMNASKQESSQRISQPRDKSQQQQQQQQRQQGQQQSGGIEISIVIPLLNENDSLKELASKIKSVLSRLTNRWEVWFIDDGSTDGSFGTLQELYRNDRRFKSVRFRRNFGKSAALSVGFQNARGEYVVTMDADLQDDPEEIPRLVEKIKSGYDLVSGWKKKRKDPINKTIPSRFFNYVTGMLSGIKIHDFNCGLKAYRRDVVKAIQLYGEMHRYIPVLARMAGFTVSEIPVTHHPRKYGRTKFGMSRFFKGFLDLLTVLFTSRYTQRPLHLFGTIGIVFFLAGIGINGYLSVEWWMGRPIGNRPILWLGILLILVGLQSISTGLLAEMIAKSQQVSTHYSVRDVLK